MLLLRHASSLLQAQKAYFREDHFSGGRPVDLFLTYCTNAVLARAADASLRQVAVPDALAVGADYGVILLSDRPEAARFVLFLLSPPGQAMLARHGFDAPGLPLPTR